MSPLHRIWAVGNKEMRLNLRFPVEYLASNLFSPVKTALMMFFLYNGLLADNRSFGILSRDTYQVYVLLGTTCHSIFMSSLSVFRSRMVSEKYWQTITATLISPASMLEVIIGFMIGSGSANLVISGAILTTTAIIHPVSFETLLMSWALLVIVSLLGFGLGLIATTFSLCWEGKAFIIEYIIQGLIFLSCFYYPLETFPPAVHGFISWLPTYCASHLMQDLFFNGFSMNFMLNFSYALISAIVLLCLPALFLDYAVKKFGIVGY